MQDKDSEALRNQRRRRKRIARIRNGIVIVVAGWIILSMILIGCMFAKMLSLEKKLDSLILSSSTVNANDYNLNDTPALDEGVIAGTEMVTESVMPPLPVIKDWVPVTPPSSGIEEEDNLAAEGDLHKVYLTFDDGPSENTEAILDILAQYGVKATFFVTGNEDEETKAVYQRIVDEGHTIGMHSYSNKYSVIYESEESFENDYQKLRDYIYELTGTTSSIYRFPGGSSNQISNVSMDYFIHFLNKEGITYYDWNVSAGDAASGAYTSEEIVENVTQDVVKYKTSVVLLHDSADKSTTVEAIGPLIESLQGMGAQILPIDEDTQVIQYVKANSVE